MEAKAHHIWDSDTAATTTLVAFSLRNSSQAWTLLYPLQDCSEMCLVASRDREREKKKSALEKQVFTEQALKTTVVLEL